MLKKYRGSNALVLAIPAGGVPVAVLAEKLGLELDVAVVSKITLCPGPPRPATGRWPSTVRCF